MNKFSIKIKHPDWLQASDPGKTVMLFQQGKLPDSIAGWMLVVSLRHPLRAIYGGDVRAALALLGMALYSKWDNATGLRIFPWRATRLFQRSERDYWLAQGLDEETLDDDERFDRMLPDERGQP